MASGGGAEGASTMEDDGVLRNLQEQIQLSGQERERAVELWHNAIQEVDRLQQLCQSTASDGHTHAAQGQQLETNQQFLRTVTEQSTEMEDLPGQLRQAKTELRTATAKVEEMTKLLKSVQDQMHRREEDTAEVQGREEASDRRLQPLQSALSQLEDSFAATGDVGVAVTVRQHLSLWVSGVNLSDPPVIRPTSEEITARVLQFIRDASYFSTGERETREWRSAQVILSMMCQNPTTKKEEAHLYSIHPYDGVIRGFFYACAGSGFEAAGNFMKVNYPDLAPVQTMEENVMLVRKAVQMGIDSDNHSGGIVRTCIVCTYGLVLCHHHQRE